MGKDDGAFRVAWGGGKPPRKGILSAIEEMAGRPSRVHLPEPPDESTPLVKIGAGDPQDDSRYQVTGEIARGGVGVIYRGRDRDLGRDVALKVLRPEHAESAAVLERFLEEAQIGAQLQHPGIVPVYGLGLQADGRPYFSMKLVKGRTLAALLKERRDPGTERRRFLRIFEQVCQTVAYAHSRGVIHRDLKPSNVMVGSFGEVQVVDWGFAKVLGRPEPARAETDTVVATVRSTEGSESISGSVMGTPAYMPPEQALGQVETLDERADVFALGAVLAHILTGEPPYTGKGHDALVQAAQARLDDCYGRLAACGADEELVGLVRRCLAPVSEERPLNAGVLAGEIDAHVLAVERRAREAQLAAVEQREALAREERRAVWERKIRRTTGAIAAVLLIAAGALAFFHVQRENEREARLAKVLPAVDRALDEAREHRAAGEWAPALAAAERAESLARGTEAERRVRGELASIRNGKAEHDALAEARGREADLLARLQETIAGPEGPDEMDQLLANAFSDFGIDLDEPTVEFERAPELLDFVDRWLFVQMQDRSNGGTTPERLLGLADALDPDPIRRRMRRAAVEGRREDLVELARGVDRSTLPGNRFAAFGMYLLGAGEPFEAARLMVVARDRFPDHGWVQEVARGAFARTGRLEDAHRAALSAAMIDGRPWQWDLVAGSAMMRSRWQEAVVAIRRAVRGWGHGGGATVGREIACLMGAGRLDDEIRAWKAELETDPDDELLRLRLATALNRVGRAAEALEVSRPFASSDDRAGLAAHAFALQASGEHEAAYEALARALQLEGNVLRGAARLLGKKMANTMSPEEAEAWVAEHLPDLAKRHRAALFAGMAERIQQIVVPPARRRVQVEQAARRAVELHPEVAEYQQLLGWGLLLARNLDAAKDAFARAVALDPRTGRYRARLGDVEWRLGHPDRALEHYLAAVRIDPLEDVALDRFAVVAAYLPAKKEVIVPEICGFADRYREFAYVQMRAAFTLLRMGEIGRALPYAERAYALDPGIAGVANVRARVLQAAGRHAGAEAAYRALLETNPGHHWGHRNLGLLLLERGDPAGAVEELKKALPIGGGQRGYVEREIAACWAQLHPEEEWVALRRKLPFFEPTYATSHVYWGAADWHHDQGRPEEALRLIEKAVAANPAYTSPAVARVIVLADLERYEEAETALEPLLRDPLVFAYLRLRLYRSLGRYERAHEVIAALRNVSRWGLPDGDRAAKLVASLRAHDRMVAEIEELEKRQPDLDAIAALERPPASSLDAVWNARLCYWNGRHEAASRWFEEAFRLDPALAEDFDAGHRFLAARAAAKAGRRKLAERWVGEEKKAWDERPPERGYREIDGERRRWMLDRILEAGK